MSEMGGGGAIKPHALDNLLQLLRHPKTMNTKQLKLLHNNRVYSHFKDKNRTPREGFIANGLINGIKTGVNR